jgi:hypothetical protein
MKKTLKLALISLSLLYPGLNSVTHAQSYVVDAQITSQPVGDGSYNYTIQLNNESSSTEPVGTFWFAWVPDAYGYDLLTSVPTAIQTPSGWSYTLSGGSYYYPDGVSIEFLNTSDAALTPGSSYTFGFNSFDSPTTLNQNSPYYPIPTLTSYVYSGGPFSDSGALILPAAVPEPSATGLLGICAVSLLLASRCRKLLLKQS